MQQALARSPVLEGIRRTVEAWNNPSLALQRAIQAVRVDALDLRVAHGGNRLGAHVTEALATRERARRRDLWGRRLREFGQAATKRLMRLASRRKVGRPVGSSLRGFAEFVFSKKSYEEIYEPLISDMRFEYCEALAANRRGKARWARVRGYGSFLCSDVGPRSCVGQSSCVSGVAILPSGPGIEAVLGQRPKGAPNRAVRRAIRPRRAGFRRWACGVVGSMGQTLPGDG